MNSRGIRVLLAGLLTLGASVAPAKSDPIPTPIAAAGAGPLYSDNVSLVTTMPHLSGMVGGRFAGTYFIATVASPAYFEPGPNSGVYIFDVSDPEAPALTGMLPLPHGENEDVDVSISRKLLLVSMETYTRYFFGPQLESAPPQASEKLLDHVYVVSWADPAKPVVVGDVLLPTRVKDGDGEETAGPGHIANCINDCKRYAYVTGAGDGALYILDLKDPAQPRIVGSAPRGAVKAGTLDPKATGGYVHDVHVDQYGRAWATGEGGTAELDVRNPLKPRPVRWMTHDDNRRWNQSVHHNALALDKATLLVTEEDYWQPGCRSPMGEQGGFQTWRVDPKRKGAGALQFLDQWVPELYSAYTGGGATPATIYCSSHWFTYNKKRVLAVGWYNLGVRFLDLTNPSHIRQVGYWMAPGTQASGAYFVPGRSDLVYVADYHRGLDVLRIANGGAGAAPVVAPLRAEWFTPEAAAFEPLGPGRQFGYACRVPRAEPSRL